MPKYEVTALQQIKYLIEVEADSDDEAEKIAQEIYAQSENPLRDFDGQDYGIEVTHVYLNGRPQPEYGK